jgi:hypothetical protein
MKISTTTGAELGFPDSTAQLCCWCSCSNERVFTLSPGAYTISVKKVAWCVGNHARASWRQHYYPTWCSSAYEIAKHLQTPQRREPTSRIDFLSTTGAAAGVAHKSQFRLFCKPCRPTTAAAAAATSFL